MALLHLWSYMNACRNCPADDAVRLKATVNSCEIVC